MRSVAGSARTSSRLADGAISASAIEARSLTRRFGDVTALDGVTLTVPRGTVFGFLGPNGAGKTTTIRLLLGLIAPSAGDLEVLGRLVPEAGLEVRRRTGVVLEQHGLYEGLSVGASLQFAARSYGLSRQAAADRVAELAARFGMQDRLRDRPATLSRGMRQRLAIARALVGRPELLVLDEPTSGLDPLLQQEFNALVRETVAEGATVFLSSHVLPEVEVLADRVAILRHGVLVAVRALDELRAEARQRIDLHVRGEVDPSRFAGVENVVRAEGGEGVVHVVVEGSVDALLKAAAQIEVLRIVTHDEDLEDTFLAYYREEGE